MKTLALGLTALTLTLAPTALAAPGDGVAREGSGDRRAALDQMELKPFPAAAWSTLQGWTGGAAPAPADLEGKVVLIGTFSSWYKTSHPAVALMESLADRFGKQGLVVLGVHDDRGWDAAPRFFADRAGKFPFAHDAGNAFRAALKSDQDPDFYVIDRAGNLRFADVETGSVEKAVAACIAESKDDAAALPAKLDAQAKTTRERSGRLGTLGERPRAADFTMPDAEAYKKAKWPWKGLTVGKVEKDRFADPAKQDAPLIKLPEDTWNPARPDTKGKVIVVYIFDPAVSDSLNIIPVMNRLQRANPNDIQVVGAAGKYDRNAAQGTEDAAKQVQKNADKIKEILQNRVVEHPMIARPFDWQQLAIQAIPVLTDDLGDYHKLAVAGIVSTDNAVRYIGYPGDDAFRASLKRILDADPGVQARRKAEEESLQRNGG